MLLYFDRRRAALTVALFFLLANSGITLYIIRFAPSFMGAGYASATLLSSIFAIFLLCWSIRNIEYLTFVGQPLRAPKLPKMPNGRI